MSRSLGVVMNGVTGRMGTNQHLVRSIAAIRAAGGVALKDGSRVQLEPVLVGRNAAKVAELAAAYGGLRWSTALDAEIANPANQIFFDAATTQMRPALLAKAIAVSASRNVMPPWAMPNPLHISERTGMRAVHDLSPTATTSMPNACEQASRAYRASATACGACVMTSESR